MNELLEDWDTSSVFRDTWIRAAADFRNYRSNIDNWLDIIEKNNLSNWIEARDFTFQYLELDPIYSRSGYTKEILVRKIKGLEFTDEETQNVARRAKFASRVSHVIESLGADIV